MGNQSGNKTLVKGTSTRLEGIDMLRGIAILLVLMRHAVPDVFGGAGIVGVVMFFALSGYLITAVLYRDISTRGRVRYGRFYRNRAFRLIPPLAFMLCGLTVVSITADPLNDRSQLLRTLLVGLSYTADIPFDHGSEAISHLWTLAVEEQFYLVWPVLLVVGYRWKRMRTMFVVASSVILIALVASLVVASPNAGKIYTLPSSWSLAMVIGAASYFGKDKIERFLPRGKFSSRFVGISALVALLGISVIPDFKESWVAYVVGGPVIAIMTVALINYVRNWAKLPFRSLRPLLALGTISYAAYLWNFAIVKWIDSSGSWRGALLVVLLTLVAATVSWYLVERPVRRLKAGLDERAKTRALEPA
jgi:peptidoglycan/LPS O-acetylase OafA/YrhL